MKTPPVSLVRGLTLLALALTFGFANEVRAGGTHIDTIAVDEFGLGTGTSGSFSFPITGSMAPDPGPGGQASALTYSFNFFGSFTAGDLLMIDPSSGTSDLVRFNQFPGSTSLVFYSIIGEGAPADTGLPSAFYTNLLNINENPSGPTSYTPTAGQPGFVQFNGGPVTYLLSSFIPRAVPESGGTMLLLSASVLGLLVVRRALQA